MSNPTHTEANFSKKDTYGLIMAGGIGSRFWPVSTEDFPKQFHDLLGCGRTLIQKTFDRISKIIPAENILILTNERYKKLVLEQLPEISESQLVLEPAMKNTAPCILLSSLKIHKRNPNSLVLVAPSDHWIEDEKAFQENILTSFETCKNREVLMTLGIQPTFPNTGYGYIQYDKHEAAVVKKVLRFTEKPDYQTAKNFLSQGNFAWNAGIFIWSTQSILSAFQKYLPEMYQLFITGQNLLNTTEEVNFINRNYPLAENISIDYGILEKAENVYLLPADFDWNDLGTWGSLYLKSSKNAEGNAVLNNNAFLPDSYDNLIYAEENKKLIISGLRNYIVVSTSNELLVVPKEQEQEIKQWLKLWNQPKV